MITHENHHGHHHDEHETGSPPSPLAPAKMMGKKAVASMFPTCVHNTLQAQIATFKGPVNTSFHPTVWPSPLPHDVQYSPGCAGFWAVLVAVCPKQV